MQLPFDVPECPRPHSFGEFMDARINDQIAIITGSNPEWRDLSGGRLELLVLHVSAHRSTHAGRRAGRFHQKGEYPLLKNKSWEQRKVPLFDILTRSFEDPL